MNRKNLTTPRSRRSRAALDVAIVGMACRFPGASNLVEFWDNIQNAVDATSDVPADRWDAEEFHQSGQGTSDRVDTRRGGYLSSPVPFDAAEFGIIPSSVDGGEPEQYLVLEAARNALRDAGLPPGMPDGKRVDVIIGRGNYFNRGHLTRLQHGRVLSQTLKVLRSLHPDWTDSTFEAIQSGVEGQSAAIRSGRRARSDDERHRRAYCQQAEPEGFELRGRCRERIGPGGARPGGSGAASKTGRYGSGGCRLSAGGCRFPDGVPATRRRSRRRGCRGPFRTRPTG